MEESEKQGGSDTDGACPTFADDLLFGADQIAGFMFGDPKKRRKVYHLVETSRLPHFRIGAILAARKSTLIQWIEKQEARAIDCAGR